MGQISVGDLGQNYSGVNSGIPYAPLRQSGRDDRKGSRPNAPMAATRVKTKRTAENKIYWRIGPSLTEPSSGFGMTSTADFSVSNHRLP